MNYIASASVVSSSTTNPVTDIQALMSAPHPGPGTGIFRASAGPGHRVPDLATVVAICVLRNGIGNPILLRDLLAPTKASVLHKRVNALGDAAGRKGLDLDRVPGNSIAMTVENRVRAALWLKDHPTATPAVAAYFDGLAVGADLFAFLGVPAAPTA